MNARQFFKRPAAETEEPPVQAPPETRPGVAPARPTERPDQPETPWRRRDVEPGEEPGPKAAYGMDTTYTDSNARQVVANLLEDDKGC
jgi:hypothetical protein